MLSSNEAACDSPQHTHIYKNVLAVTARLQRKHTHAQASHHVKSVIG